MEYLVIIGACFAVVVSLAIYLATQPVDPESATEQPCRILEESSQRIWDSTHSFLERLVNGTRLVVVPTTHALELWLEVERKVGEIKVFLLPGGSCFVVRLIRGTEMTESTYSVGEYKILQGILRRFVQSPEFKLPDRTGKSGPRAVTDLDFDPKYAGQYDRITPRA